MLTATRAMHGREGRPAVEAWWMLCRSGVSRPPGQADHDPGDLTPTADAVRG